MVVVIIKSRLSSNVSSVLGVEQCAMSGRVDQFPSHSTLDFIFFYRFCSCFVFRIDTGNILRGTEEDGQDRIRGTDLIRNDHKKTLAGPCIIPTGLVSTLSIFYTVRTKKSEIKFKDRIKR